MIPILIYSTFNLLGYNSEPINNKRLIPSHVQENYPVHDMNMIFNYLHKKKSMDALESAI